MITVLLATLAIFLLVVGAMAIGVMVTGRALRGSCGGVGADCACEKAGVAPGSGVCENPKTAEPPPVKLGWKR